VLQNFKNKNMLLLLLFLLALLLCYKLAIFNTLAFRKEYLSLKKEEQLFKNIPQQLALLTKKEMYLDSVLKKWDMNNSTMENNLLRVVNKQAAQNNIKVIDFNAPHISSESVLTYIFTLEGSYVSLVKIIHDLENKRNFGSISHLSLEKKRHYRSKKNYLQALVFLEQIK
jgi:hypothetical protein